MLKSLTINNIVLVDTLELTLQRGLTMLSGETGAGKSILLDALGLVIGGRGDSNLVRYQCDKALVQGIFSLSQNHVVWNILDELDIIYDKNDDIILQRSITNDGKSKARINGIVVNIGTLRLVGETLVDVQGQFEQHGLLNPKQHKYILDGYSGLHNDVKTLNDYYQQWKESEDNYQALLEAYERDKADSEYILHCLAELDMLEPQENEEEYLLSVKSRIKHAEKIQQNHQGIEMLIGADKGISDSLGKIERLLNATLDKSTENKAEMLAMIDKVITIQDDMATIKETVTQYAYDISDSANESQEIEERLFGLADLARKHRVDISDLPRIHKELKEKSTLLENSDGVLEHAQNLCTENRDKYIALATNISTQRHNHAIELSEKVTANLPSLGLQSAEFTVSMERENIEDCTIDTVFSDGIDRVIFSIKTNVGGTYSPLHKSASGGELSRILLSINCALAEKTSEKTLMFDEIDSGVGGKSASAIGQKLRQLSQYHQVFVITHSPQVAASGDSHMHVRKYSDETSTTSTITTLSMEQRIQEVARMLSGENITAEAIANAETLIHTSHT